MNIIIILIIILALSIGLFLLIKHILFANYVLNNFKRCNVITFGKKGNGKDIIHQWVIYKRKNEEYYANIDYGYNGEIVKIKSISCEPNTYENIINDKIVQTEHLFKEKADIYLSDVGIFLPSQMDSSLHKHFPSMPIFYALSRHLYANNIHCNAQNLNRVWKALREQADFYVCCKGVTKVFNYLIVKIVTYDKYESALANLLPMKSRILNKYSRAELDKYNAMNGEIRQGHIIINKKHIKYDTRAFEKILLKGARLPQSNGKGATLK